MAVQAGLCRTWSETPKTGFLKTRLILEVVLMPLCQPTALTSTTDDINGRMLNYELACQYHYMYLQSQNTRIFIILLM